MRAGQGLAARLGSSSPWLAIVCAITAIFLFAMLGAICVLSVPCVRRNHHNLFELSHRYVGWSLLGMLWIHVTVKAAYWANFNALGQELPQDQKVGCSNTSRLGGSLLRFIPLCSPAKTVLLSCLELGIFIGFWLVYHQTDECLLKSFWGIMQPSQ